MSHEPEAGGMLRLTVDLHSWWVLDFSFLREFIAKSSISDYDKTHLQLKGVVKRGRNHRFTGGDSGFVRCGGQRGAKTGPELIIKMPREATSSILMDAILVLGS